MEEQAHSWRGLVIVLVVAAVIAAVRQLIFERNLRSYDPFLCGKSVAEAEKEEP